MSIQLFELGEERARLIVIDNFVEDPDLVVRQAAELAPYPEVADNRYPGVRRLLDPDRDAAYAYVDLACRGIAPLMHQAYGIERFAVTEAGFSLVTRPPEKTEPIQRIPHYDSFDPANIAVLHYLSPRTQGGTAFYRHRRTGFVMLTESRFETYLTALEEDMRLHAPPVAYADDSTETWERIGFVDARYNRCVIYQGAVFHSGILPPGFAFSDDPLHGRLTGNIFLRGT